MTALRISAYLWLGLLAGPAAAAPDAPASPQGTEAAAPVGLSYPQARRGRVVDTYHGQMVADPYRWLEDPDSPETRTWVEAQVDLTSGWLSEIPRRKEIRDWVESLWSYERFGIPYDRSPDVAQLDHDGDVDALQSGEVLLPESDTPCVAPAEDPLPANAASIGRTSSPPKPIPGD